MFVYLQRTGTLSCTPGRWLVSDVRSLQHGRRTSDRNKRNGRITTAGLRQSGAFHRRYRQKGRRAQAHINIPTPGPAPTSGQSHTHQDP